MPTLLAAAHARFVGQPPHRSFEEDGDRAENWDGADLDPWDGLPWPTVSVLRYLQHHLDGTVVEAYWLTDLPPTRFSSHTVYQCAKARWTIENQGFNEAKSRYGLRHVPHHHANSLLIHWLLLVKRIIILRISSSTGRQ